MVLATAQVKNEEHGQHIIGMEKEKIQIGLLSCATTAVRSMMRTGMICGLITTQDCYENSCSRL
jgi:hypothetical protein